MKRPIELRLALAVLVLEYLIVVPSYISVFWARIEAHELTSSIAMAFVVFLIVRPLVLYLLWRGTSWVRTYIVWALPITLGLMFLLHGHRHPGAAAPDASSGTMYEAYRTLAGHGLVTAIALLFGAMAFLCLYSPRVGAWYRYMKESRAKQKTLTAASQA